MLCAQPPCNNVAVAALYATRRVIPVLCALRHASVMVVVAVTAVVCLFVWWLRVMDDVIQHLIRGEIWKI